MAVPTPTITHEALAIRQDSSSSITGDLPLTTIFTPPASCFSRPYGLLNENTNSGQPSAFLDYSAADTDCYPTSYSELELSTNAWYSPGACPSGYARASQQTDAADNLPQLTLAWCCPSGLAFSQDGNGNQYCSTYIATSTSVRSAGGVNSAYSEFVGLQWPISVMWSSQDLNSFTPASAPVLDQAQTTSATGAKQSGTKGGKTATATFFTSSSTATGQHTGTGRAVNQNNNSGGLSTGAQAGIGVGVAIPCLALLIFGIWFFLYRRRTKASKKPGESDSPIEEKTSQPFMGAKAELPGAKAQSPQAFPAEHKAAIPGEESQPAELEPEQDGLNELPEQNKVASAVELPGSTIGPQAAAGMRAEQSPIRASENGTSVAERDERAPDRPQ